jgi:glycosyltransferase involved in cell wall biosynthesis
VHFLDRHLRIIPPIQKLRRLVRENRLDSVIAFLRTPSVYSMLTKLLVPSLNVIVSERSSSLNDQNYLTAYLSRKMYFLASYITANSYAHGEWLNSHFSLGSKLKVIWNGYNIPSSITDYPDDSNGIDLLVIGRVTSSKNVHNLISALALLAKTQQRLPRIRWAGRIAKDGDDGRYFRKMCELLDGNPAVKKVWQWLGERNDVSRLLDNHHALIHPSLFEGLPNAVCESLAQGRPVLASDIGDHRKLIEPPHRGFLFKPTQPSEIADAIMKFTSLEPSCRHRMAIDSWRFASDSLSIDKMTASFVELLRPKATDTSLQLKNTANHTRTTHPT